MTRLERLQEFLVQDPNDTFTHYAIALEHLKLGDHEAAKNQLESIRSQTPNYVPTYYQLAGLYHELGDNERAVLTYHDGIVIARQERDLHAAGELQQALSELEDELS